MNKRQMVGAIVAMAAAGVLAANNGLADGDKKAADKKAEKKASMKCVGGNACSGKGACASADGKTSCAGKNSCKGKGWTMVSSAEECTKAGGTVAEEKKEAPKAEEKKS